MFNPNRTVIDAFVGHTIECFREAFPGCEHKYQETLELAAHTALETLLECDCAYHDLQHTMLVTDVGQTILRGRLISQGDVNPLEWLHAVIAMLFHDIGYLRGLLKDDREGDYVADNKGNRITPPPGTTDAYLMPCHVSRGCMYIQERFASDPLIDVSTISGHIEMTRFPVPDDKHYQNVESFAALVRAADLIGQMGDPLYQKKLPRLYSEILETGEASRLGYATADDLRAQYQDFFYARVYPYITEGLKFLRKTQDGQQWIANLFHQVHELRDGAREAHPEPAELSKPPVSGPQIAFSNR